MNTASQDLTGHLEILRDKLTHPTDYELALAYFLEEFAGDLGFHVQGQKEEAAHLRPLLVQVAATMLQRNGRVRDFGAFYLPGHGFFHGRMYYDGMPLIFFYFEGINVGMATLVRLGMPEQLVARWQLPERAVRNPGFN